jgi:hypothetical protein
LVALLWILLFSPTVASAVDLFSFGYRGKILAFAVQSSDPAAASVKDNAAETTALNWAVRFYGAQDIDREEMELRIAPTRFWFHFRGSNIFLFSVLFPESQAFSIQSYCPAPPTSCPLKRPILVAALRGTPRAY